MHKSAKIIVLLLILGLAAFYRFYGLNWDQGQGMHPDERFLAMVTNDGKLPQSFLDYLDPQTSTLNPYNYNFNFFVYGTFPISLNKFLIGYFMPDDYGHIFLFGRTLSALFDLSTVLAVFLLSGLLQRNYSLSEKLPAWAALTYSMMVLPIQHAHFFTTDSFLNAFSIWSLYFALKLHFSGNTNWVLPCAVCWGLALACKISALYIMPLILVLIIVSPCSSFHPREVLRSIFSPFAEKLLRLFSFTIIAYFILRLGDPRFFAYGNFLDPTLNPKFLSNIRELQSMSVYNGGIPYPPAVQWINKPDLWFALKNIFFFGLGIVASVFALGGLGFWRNWKSNTFLFILGWSICFYCYQSTQFAKSLRYFYILYPLFAVLAGHCISRLLAQISSLRIRQVAGMTILCLLLVWPEMFRAIYKQEHTRVTASRWIYQNIPAGATLGNIHWDDGLPLHLPDAEHIEYRYVELGVFGPDDEQKWQALDRAYQKIDYMILSSNRGYGSMMPLPELFPRTTKFYQDLFDEKLEYKKVAEFSAFPKLDFFGLKYELNDQWSEEAFTVYDHPLVTIFKKIK